MPYPEYQRDVAVCQAIHRTYGKSFYYGTILFPRAAREAVCILYAFFRVPDEYVDTEYAHDGSAAREELLEWQTRWQAAYEGREVRGGTSAERQVLRAAAYVFHRYQIPFSYSEAFVRSMLADTETARYETYEALETYMYGSAAVVGLMVTHVLCDEDPRFQTDFTYQAAILDAAAALGYAFQLTNFLRDVGDDYDTRGRIYLPEADMRQCNVTEQMIRDKRLTPEYGTLMQYYYEKTEACYALAQLGLAYLPLRGRIGVRVASALYHRILERLAAKQFDNLSERIVVPTGEKLRVALRALV